MQGQVKQTLETKKQIQTQKLGIHVAQKNITGAELSQINFSKPKQAMALNPKTEAHEPNIVTLWLMVWKDYSDLRRNI